MLGPNVGDAVETRTRLRLSGGRLQLNVAPPLTRIYDVTVQIWEFSNPQAVES